jgi:hypothetical protein
VRTFVKAIFECSDCSDVRNLEEFAIGSNSVLLKNREHSPLCMARFTDRKYAPGGERKDDARGRINFLYTIFDGSRRES